MRAVIFCAVAVLLPVALSLTACGDSFVSSGPATSGGGGGTFTASSSGATGSSSGGGATTASSSGNGGGSAGSGAGGAGGAGGGGAAPPVTVSSCGSGMVGGAGELLFWSTLDSDNAILSPMVGDGTGAMLNVDSYPPTSDGFGAQLINQGSHVALAQQVGATVNLDPSQGAIDFCYRPNFNHTDGQDHFWLTVVDATATNRLLTIKKSASINNNEIHVNGNDGANLNQYAVLPGDYTLSSGVVYRITVTWTFTAAVNDARVYIDGVLLAGTMISSGANSDLPGPMPSGGVVIGAADTGSTTMDGAAGVIDELFIYDGIAVPQ
jgi:hypothetical protein